MTKGSSNSGQGTPAKSSFPAIETGSTGGAAGTVNGIEVGFLLDAGATDVAVPPELALRLKRRRGPDAEIRTASDVIPGYLVRLDELNIGPLTRRCVRGSVSDHFIGEELLLGMSFLRHFELSQRGRTITLRAPTNR